MQLWTEKYFPQSLEGFVGNSEIVRQAHLWALQWQKGEKQKPLLFFGPTGIGKTALAFLLAKELKWSLFELNASDSRSKDVIEKVAGGAAFNASFSGQKRLVLLDEIDGLQGREDKGGAAAVLDVLKQAQNPVILTANDVYGDKKLASIRGFCQKMEFRRPSFPSIAKFLREICEKENIDYDQESLTLLAKNASGDIRSSLLDLQTICEHSKKITLQDVKELGFRERQERIFEVLNSIFKAKTVEEARTARFSSDLSDDMLLRWIEENIPRAFKTPEEQMRAFEQLSRADIFLGRIFKRQHYGFLKYAGDLSTAGVALSGEAHGFLQLQFPQILSQLSASSSLRLQKSEIAEKMQSKMFASKRELVKDFPYWKTMLEKEEFAVNFAAAFDWNEDDLGFLLEAKSDSKKVKVILEKAKELKHSQLKTHLHSLEDHKHSEEHLEAAEEVLPLEFEPGKQTKLF
ncbi:MAG: replication factor C large subunit [Candidatus Diapherotrites archaeon]